ncbi:defense against restriction protein [Escherichia coli]|nr:defense against restriction protein [Escherichia coli]
MKKITIGVFRCSSVSEILKYIRAITPHKAPIRYGVEKVKGKSYDRLHLSRKAESPLVYRY